MIKPNYNLKLDLGYKAASAEDVGSYERAQKERQGHQ
jgi:hypothetical protein